MKPMIVVLLLAAATVFAHADGINLTNEYGSISVSNAGIVSNESQIKTFNGMNGVKGRALGYLNYATGALMSGSIAAGGTFSATGSSFDIYGAYPGMPKGTIFSGTFVGPINWIFDGASGVHGNNLTYTLSGTIEGMLYTGRMVTGETTQTIYSTNGQLAQGIGHIRGGRTTLGAPEPSELLLFGSGLVAIAGAVRRRLLV
jgi:hypothetical protein